MDPELVYRRLSDIVDRVLYGEELNSDCEELADLFDALDNWLKKGGFLPKAWQR